MTKFSRFSLSLSFRHWSLRSSLVTEQTLGINTLGSVDSVAWNSLKWVIRPILFFLIACVHACLLSCFSRVWPWDPMDCGPPDSSVLGVLQARGLQRVAMPPPPGGLPDPEIKPASPAAPTDQVDSLLLSPQGSPLNCIHEGWTP